MNPDRYKPALNTPKVEAEKPQQTSDEQKDNYELSVVEHELVSKYQPKFLARGGEHIIYDIPDHPNIVVKVKADLIKMVIWWNVEHEQPIDSLPVEIELRAREYLKKEAGRYQQLKKYFGAEHVPSQKEFLVKVPITEDILNALYDGKPPATTNEVWSAVIVQKRVGALSDPRRLTIVAGYAEREDVSEDLYNQATQHFVFGKNPEQKFEKEKFLEIQSNNDLKALVEKSALDENLRETLKDLVEKMVSYTEDTGEIFDFAGQDNIVLFRKDGKWTYTLVDVRYPGGSKMVDEAKVALLKLSVGNEIDEREKNILLNIFNFVRVVNGLAEQVGAQKRINIIPEGMKEEVMDFLKIIR